MILQLIMMYDKVMRRVMSEEGGGGGVITKNKGRKGKGSEWKITKITKIH